MCTRKAANERTKKKMRDTLKTRIENYEMTEEWIKQKTLEIKMLLCDLLYELCRTYTTRKGGWGMYARDSLFSKHIWFHYTNSVCVCVRITLTLGYHTIQRFNYTLINSFRSVIYYFYIFFNANAAIKFELMNCFLFLRHIGTRSYTAKGNWVVLKKLNQRVSERERGVLDGHTFYSSSLWVDHEARLSISFI